ncbi:MAG: type II toxin-antitoxin system VapC family toxin [Chloroflexota bacterium]
MIVLDASAAVDFLIGARAFERIAARIGAPGETLHAPHLLDVEVAHALRRLVLRGAIPAGRAEQALEDLAELRIRRYSHARLLPRVWEIRANVTAFDAVYVALAEALGAPLLTTDAALSRSPAHAAVVELVN